VPAGVTAVESVSLPVDSPPKGKKAGKAAAAAPADPEKPKYDLASLKDAPTLSTDEIPPEQLRQACSGPVLQALPLHGLGRATDASGPQPWRNITAALCHA
jgi:hypothetical protein